MAIFISYITIVTLAHCVPQAALASCDANGNNRQYIANCTMTCQWQCLVNILQMATFVYYIMLQMLPIAEHSLNYCIKKILNCIAVTSLTGSCHGNKLITVAAFPAGKNLFPWKHNGNRLMY